MSDYAKLQTRCQRGEGRIADANNLLAECYGALGRLIAENERLSIASGCHLLRAQTLEVERDELLGNLAGAQGMLETAYSERDQLKAQVEKFRTDAQDALAGQMHLINERDLLKAENEALRKALSECADSLHGEMLQKFAGQQPEDMHPVTRRDYDRDMAEVAGYRAALSKGEQP
ncbi:hypothetical protein [Pseudomonas saponiphila]|uniref:hypothetical protein n=1 Tax=Pseudomonas saponiphila TaxID=556534 RepID=UPI002240A65E|nr:hypothetical protein [Pseudomonas saponiphila]